MTDEPDFARISALLTSYWKGAVIYSAVKVGLFEALGRGKASLDEISEATARAQNVLCNFLKVFRILLHSETNEVVVLRPTNIQCKNSISHSWKLFPIIVLVFYISYTRINLVNAQYVSTSKNETIMDYSNESGNYDTSEYMIGSVAVSLILMESNGTIDQNREDWTNVEETRIIQEVTDALNWWEAQNPSAHLSFILETHLQVPTKYEPIIHSSQEDNLWQGDALSFFSYSGNFSSRHETYLILYEYANDLRDRHNTNWAFIIFVVDSSRDLDGKFPDGLFGYAYPGGPSLVMTYDNNGWKIGRMNEVAAHELAHIFYASDEYNNEKQFRGYLNASDNDNSGALMDARNLRLSVGTREQIGWRDSDADGILDIVDTFPQTILFSRPSNLVDSSTVMYEGSVSEIPYPNHNPDRNIGDITINTIKSVLFRVDDGQWINAMCSDGQFDSSEEHFTFTISGLSIGNHIVEVLSVNSVNNTDETVLFDEFTVTHVIVDESYSSNSRVDIGTSQEIGFHAIWAHDRSPISSGYIYINGSSYRIDSNGWVKIHVSSELVGKQNWIVEAVSVSGISSFTVDISFPSIIWDRFEITNIFVNDSRIDAGSFFELGYEIRYDYDDDVFNDKKGNVNGFTWDGIRNLWKNTIVSSSVVESTIFDEEFISINDLTHSLTVKEDVIGIEVITDKIRMFESGSYFDRVEVGKQNTIYFSMIYDYDSTPVVDGIVLINDENAEYDNTRHQWEMAVTQIEVGKWDYTVSSVYDNEPGISLLDDSLPSVEIIFDKIILDYQTGVNTPGGIQFSFHINYQYDDTTIENAQIHVDDVVATNLGSGFYSLHYPTWLPQTDLEIIISIENFNAIKLAESILIVGNVLIYAAITILSVSIGVFVWRRQRT